MGRVEDWLKRAAVKPNLANYEVASLSMAMTAPLFVGVMVYLVASFEPVDIQQSGNPHAGPTIVCMSLAAMATTLSIFFAIRPMVNARWKSLFWIIPLAIAWLCFFQWYNWGKVVSGDF